MFNLKFETDNDAFGDSFASRSDECARILREIAETLSGKYAEDCGTIRDANGNSIGRWVLGPGEGE
jgi:hypothetical protein